MVTSCKRSHACTATLSAPNPAAGHHPPTPPLETPGHSQAILGPSLVGSLLLSPGSWCTGSVCALQESMSQSCVSSGSSMVGLIITSSKRAYAIPKFLSEEAEQSQRINPPPTDIPKFLSQKGNSQPNQFQGNSPGNKPYSQPIHPNNFVMPCLYMKG